MVAFRALPNNCLYCRGGIRYWDRRAGTGIRYRRYRIRYWEVNDTKSYEFMNRLYAFLDNQKNQGVYAVRLFNAAGSYYFRLSENRQHQTNEYLEAERRYAIDQSLTDEIKESFPNPINLDGLAAFIDKNMSDSKLSACMAEFGIPSGAAQDKDLFSQALAAQFSLFVTSADEDVDDAVWEMYQTLLKGQPITADDISGPRYAGDDVYVEFDGKQHEADCYETIHHEWKLQNRGKVAWHNRRLVLVNQKDIHPRPVQAVIPVPDTEPRGFTKIAAHIDARGFEGNYECKWEMQDADGENCFPNKRWDFNIRIRVTFQPEVEGDGRG